MLDAIIDEVAAHQPAPLNRPTAVLTGRGHAALAAYRFLQTLRELDATDRAYILDLLKLELCELPPTA